MKVHRIENFTKGWFIGDFEPSLFKTKDFEICIKLYTKGDYDKTHVHKVATEYIAIVDGTVRMNGNGKSSIYSKGDLIEIMPGDYTDFEALTDATTIVVKVPCVKGDKYE